MSKYAVICYAVHDTNLASCDWFTTREAAQNFLERDAANVYEDEIESSYVNAEGAQIEVEDGYASVTSCEGEYCWTWHIIAEPANDPERILERTLEKPTPAQDVERARKAAAALRVGPKPSELDPPQFTPAQDAERFRKAADALNR